MKEYLTIPQTAKRYHYGQSTLYLWCQRGICPHIRVNRTVRIPIVEFEEWLARQTQGGHAGVGPVNAA